VAGYVAIIGDVVRSRSIERRGEFQDRIARCFAVLNRKSGAALASPYTITLGDEFQAVYRRADGVIADAVRLLHALYPERVRLAWGIGSIATPINPDAALGMDGPAFHLARDGIEELKTHARTVFRVCGSDCDAIGLVNASLALLAHQLNGWKHTSFALLTGLADRRSPGELAHELDMTVRGVYKNMQTNAIQDVWNLVVALGRSVEAERKGTA
jgi:hypothetical protein